MNVNNVLKSWRLDSFSYIWWDFVLVKENADISHLDSRWQISEQPETCGIIVFILLYTDKVKAS